MTDKYWQVVQHEIEKALAALFPHGDGTATAPRVQHVLETVARQAYQHGQNAALMSLLTIDDALAQVNAWLQEKGVDPITKRRLVAIARNRHERFGIGWKPKGKTNLWLFRPEEIERLRPKLKYRGEDEDEEDEGA